MRAIFAAVVLMLVACDAQPPQGLRLVTLHPAHSPGVSLRELPAATLQSIDLAYGLAVVQASTAAERAGLRVGDVVYGVERTPIASIEDFNRLLAEHAGGGVVGLLVRRGRSDFYVAIDLEGGEPRGARRPGPARDTLLRT